MMKRISAGILSLLLIAFFLPVLVMLFASFLQDDPGDAIRNGVHFSLGQYKILFNNRDMLLRFRNSAVISGMTMAIQIPVAIMGGFWLAKRHGKACSIVRLCMIIALLLPFQSVMVPVFRISKWAGLYDHQIAVVLLQAFSALGPLTIWILIRSIPEEQWESALLDTSSSWTVYFRIILPQLLSGFAVLLLLCFAEVWNLVEQPLILIHDEELLPASLSLNDLKMKETAPYAGAVVYSLPVLIMYGLAMMLLRNKKMDVF